MKVLRWIVYVAFAQEALLIKIYFQTNAKQKITSEYFLTKKNENNVLKIKILKCFWWQDFVKSRLGVDRVFWGPNLKKISPRAPLFNLHIVSAGRIVFVLTEGKYDYFLSLEFKIIEVAIFF